MYAALRAGAAGFLLKDAPPERLLAAVQAVTAGDRICAPTVVQRLIDAYAEQTPATVELEPLTSRETEVLILVGRAMSNGDIARHLVVSEATVKTHVNRVTKLGLASRAQAVALAYEAGLVRPRRRY